MSENFIISVYNIKGGCGKTVISYTLAREFNTLLASNEDNIFTDFYGDSMKIAAAEKLPIVKSDPIIYDFGGFAEKGILNILQQSNLVIVPTYYDDEALKKTIKIISEIKQHNKNIIIVATRTEKQQFKKIVDILGSYTDNKILQLRKTALFLEMTETGKSFKSIVNKNNFTKKAYKGIKEDFKQLKKLIKEYI